MMHRITASMTTTALRNHLQENSRTLAELQERAASRQAIRRPSDDPQGTQSAMATRAEAARATQYERNLQNADTWLKGIDSALQGAADVMSRVNELTLRTVNGATPPSARQATAADLEQLRDQMLAFANTQVMGRSVFAGTSTAASAYSGTPATWNGIDGSAVQRRISETETVQVDVPGPQVFGDGQASVFAALDRLITGLRAGTDVSGSVAEVQSAQARVTDALATAGTRHASVLRSLESVQGRVVQLEASRMVTEEADLAETAVRLQTQQVYYQAALAVTAQAIQPSLMDFLR